MMPIYCMTMNCVLVSLILQDKEKILKIITSQLQGEMHVKVIQEDPFFARLMTKLCWSVLFLMEAVAVKKESLEFTLKSTISKNGLKQVNQVLTFFRPDYFV